MQGAPLFLSLNVRVPDYAPSRPAPPGHSRLPGQDMLPMAACKRPGDILA